MERYCTLGIGLKINNQYLVPSWKIEIVCLPEHQPLKFSPQVLRDLLVRGLGVIDSSKQDWAAILPDMSTATHPDKSTTLVSYAMVNNCMLCPVSYTHDSANIEIPTGCGFIPNTVRPGEVWH